VDNGPYEGDLNVLPGASDRVNQLLQVQDHDTAIDQLVHRQQTLPQRSELKAVESELATLASRRAEVAVVRDELGGRQAALEEQISSSRTRRAEIEKRLYGGQVSAARELQAMDEEVKHLARHVGELEDKELEVMVELEPLDADLEASDAESARLHATGDTLREEIAAKEKEIEVDLERDRNERSVLAAGVPADLLAGYEQIRSRLGGTGAARIVGGSCGGCHLQLPAMELDRVRKAGPDEIIYCDQCGRILVR